jgi:hypothetical protein
MRHVFGLVILAVALAITGCSLFRDPKLHVADVTSITAPDTTHAETTFNVVVHAVLGSDLRWKLDHVEVTYADSSLDVRVWSRDVSRPGYGVPQLLSECDLTFEAGPTEPGEFRVIAHQPNGSTTEKIITVLP